MMSNKQGSNIKDEKIKNNKNKKYNSKKKLI